MRWKRQMAWVLSLVMILSLLPVTVLADGQDSREENQVPAVEQVEKPALQTDDVREDESASLGEKSAEEKSAIQAEASFDDSPASTDAAEAETAASVLGAADRMGGPGDGAASLQSMMPLKEEYLDDINMTGYFLAELTDVSIRTLLAGAEDIPEGASVAWAERYHDDFTVTDMDGKINLTELADSDLDYDQEIELQFVVGTPDQLTKSNVRYFVSVRIGGIRDSLNASIISANAQRDAIEILESYMYHTTSRNTETGEETEYYSYSMTTDVNWDEGPVFLSLNQADGFGTNLTAQVYEGFHSLDDLKKDDHGGAQEITSRVWAKEGLLQTASEDNLYKCSPGSDRAYRFAQVTVLWARDNQPVFSFPVEIRIEKTEDYVSFDSPRGANDSWYRYDHSERDPATQLYRYYYRSNIPGTKATEPCSVRAFFYHNESETPYSDFDVKVVAGPVRYETYSAAIQGGAADVTTTIFGNSGYTADYSKGIVFTAFDKDGGWMSYEWITTVDTPESPASSPSSNTYFRMEKMADT